MMWTRWRHVLLVVAVVAVVPLQWLASGAGRFAGPGVASFRDLALAGPGQVAGILGAWSAKALAPAAIGALLWDLPFLVALALAAGLLAMALARPLAGGFGWLGPAAAAGAMLASAADVVEDVLLLAALDRPDGDLGALAPAAGWCSRAKLALWGVTVLSLLALAAMAALRAFHTPTGREPLGWDEPEVPRDGTLLDCDLVMKGGITSGVVYPGAVWALSKRYRFRSIGGSSAGAIAAAVAAAAEYRRRTATTPAGRGAGFETLKRLTEELTRQDALFHLFQPASSGAPLFDVLAAVLRPGSVVERFLWGAWTAVGAFPLASLMGLVPVAAVGWAAGSPPSGSAAAWIFASGAALASLTLLVSLAGAAVVRLLWLLRKTGHGLCPGPTQGSGRAGKGLSDWLADAIDEIAFGTEPTATSEPLTLGHLWRGGPPADAGAPGLAREPAEPVVRFQVLTTSLTHGQPYRVPFDKLPLWFRKSDLEKVLPQRVVAHMVRRGRLAAQAGEAPTEAEVVPLPRAGDLPVIFLARMSLSFPGLLSAPELIGRRYPVKGKPAIDGGGPEAEAEAGPRAAGPAKPSFEPHWFSDGGISSNFPIHFFDQPIPEWPTFGLDLGRAAPDAPDEGRVWLPHRNDQGIGAPWRAVASTSGFGGAVLAALHAWLDNMQKRAPGYRDRIARIDLTEQEGGFNLRMPPALIRKIAGFGNEAGIELARWFEPRAVGAPPAPPGTRRSKVPGWAWDNHRWVRFRSTVALLEGFICNFSADLQKPPVLGARGYPDLIAAVPDPPPSYDLEGAWQQARAVALTDRLVLLGVTPPGLAEGAPRPEPELRIIPKV